MLGHRPPSVMSSSSESSTAPMDFNVCHSLENSLQTPPVKWCHTCRQMRRNFNCADCVRVGDISHSRALFKESFCTKKMKLSDREREKHKYAAIIEERSQPYRQRDEVRQFIVLAKQRAESRAQLIIKYSHDVSSAKRDIVDIRKKCKEIREKRSTLPERKKTCIHETAKLRNHIEEVKSKLTTVSAEIDTRVQELVQDLRSSIFPISEIRSSNRGAAQRRATQEAAELEEALCTNYIRGKWVYSNHSVDESYSIGAPCLPADGNYSQLIEWVQQRQDQNTLLRDDAQDPAYEIAAGLMHLTQMIKQLAFFLDLKLPYVMCFSEFSAETLTEDGLANKIARLNGNVVFMCASQNVDPTLIYSRKTVQNVLNILDRSDFPRIQGFEPGSTLTSSIEEGLAKHLQLCDVHAELDLVGDSRAGPRDSGDDDENEWITVSTTNLPSSPSIDQSYAYSTTSVMGRPRTASESFFDSAAALVSGLWFSTSTSQRQD